jgi:hypothetical protein
MCLVRGFCMMDRNRILLFVLLSAPALTAHAVRFSVQPVLPFVYIQIGHGSMSDYGLLGPPAGQIDEVVFALPAGGQAGDGTPIAGTPVIPIMFLGYSGGNRANYLVTMNSSAGLVNARGDRIDFSEFSWTTQDGDIPPGQFDDSANQLLQQYSGNGRRARGVVDYLTFSFANVQIHPGGTYTGRVVYTVTEL